ncbi:MAG: DUF6930 domain-containing protein [Pseudanabaenaceae cyanobacterium]
MTTLNSATLRNLAKLRATDSLWEGDRRTLPRRPYSHSDSSNVVHLGHTDHKEQPQCILWVDATKGVVRAMDVVDPNAGQEAFVRSLIQAMERPQGPSQPSLPKRILVRDRELQFYLRGILQDLKIQVEYAEELPLIEDIFANIIEHSLAEPPMIPPAMANGLLAQSAQIWQSAPWEVFWDHQVVCIEMNCWDIENFFVVVMGRLGLEQGIILYRSYSSLIKFRQKLLASQEGEVLEETFLGQDCLFNLFETVEGEGIAEDRFLQMHGWLLREVRPIFGSLHPLEGGRSYLYEEEAMAMTIALNAFSQFYRQHRKTLAANNTSILNNFPDCRGVYEISSPQGKHQITVRTMPELTQELFDLVSEEEPPIVRDDLIPPKTLTKLQEVSWETIEILEKLPIYHKLGSGEYTRQDTGMSALLIQTTRSKGIALLQEIEQRGGLRGVGFNPAESPLDEPFELGMLVLGNGELQLFAEFPLQDRKITEALTQWKQRCLQLNNRCVVMVAMGVTGAAKGKPRPEHYLACFEVECLTAEQLDLGVLRARLFGSDDEF